MFQKNSGVEKTLSIRKGAFTFFRRFFCLTLPKNFLCNSSVFQKTSGSEKNWMDERGGNHVSLLKVFRLTVPKVLNGNSSLFQQKSYSGNFLWMLGVISSFYVRFFLSHSNEKIRGNPSMFQNNSGVEKILRIFFVSHHR